MNQNKSYSILIGIDPGVKTGICFWSPSERKVLLLEGISIHHAMERVKRQASMIAFAKKLKVRIEDARLRKWIPKQKNEKAERGKREGAGSVKRDCKIWEDFLTDLGIDFELVPPKNNKTKVTAEYFKKLTGYEGTTNEHSRDAAMLVVGY
jgi:hypothetical protein